MILATKANIAAGNFRATDNPRIPYPVGKFDMDKHAKKLRHKFYMDGNPEESAARGRVFRVWQKIKAGLISGESAEACRRNYRKQFAEFARQESMI